MKIINFKLYSKDNVFICIKLLNKTSHIYKLTNEILSRNLNTKNKIYKHILKLTNLNVKKVYLYKIRNVDRYNQKHINSCKKLN
jgi:hypothetical protein